MPSLYGQSGNVTVNSSNTTGLYAIANTANVVTANISSVNTTGLYGLASNVFVPSSAQQLLNLLSNNGTVIFQLDPSYANQKVEAFATGGGSGNLIINLVGDVTGLGSTGAPLFTTLSNTGVVSGTYGNSAYWPTFTVSANGRIMTASTGNLASYLSGNVTIGNLAVTGNTSSNSIIITTGIFYANGTPFVSSSYGNANVAAFLPTYGGNITANNVTVTGNLSVTGNVNVSGNVFYTNVNTIVTTTIVANSTTDSTSTSTGAIVSFGGLGVAANIYANKINSVTGFFYAGNGQPYYGNATVAAYLPVNPTWTGYLTFANANAATQATSINSINANLGAYQTFANANAASQQTQINNLVTTANANVAAYLLGNTRQGNVRANTVTVGPFGGVTGAETYSGVLSIAGATGALTGKTGGYGPVLTLSSNTAWDSLYGFSSTIRTVSNSSAVGFPAAGIDSQIILGGNIAVPQALWVGNSFPVNQSFWPGLGTPVALFEGNVVYNFYNYNSGGTVKRVSFYNPVTISGFNSNLNVSGGANVVIGDGLNGGNITVATGGYYLGDGSKLTGVVSTYGNTQVAAYLPTYTGNLSPSNLFTNNIRFANGQPYNFGSTYSNANVAAYLITNTGNIAAGNIFSNNYLYANGVSILTGIGGTYSNVNVAAYIPTDPTITGIQANVGTLYLGNISTNANLGAFQTYANVTFSTVANAASQQTQIDTNTAGLSTLNANVGAYQIYGNVTFSTQANAASQQTSIDTINANLGSYQTYANTQIQTVNANLGAYQTFANANAASQATSINTINANLGAYQTYGNVTFSTVANAASQQTQINSLSSSLSTTIGQLETLDANVGAFETYANATFVTTGGNYGNANVAAYLPTYQGDIGNVLYNAGTGYFTSLYASRIDSLSGAVVTNKVTSEGSPPGPGLILSTFYDLPVTIKINELSGPSTYTFGGNGNITLASNTSAINYANGVNILSGITGTYGNTQVAAYLPTDPTFTGYLTFANANAASQAISINSINANLGAYQTYANVTFSTVANAASQQTSINSINANLGAYQIYGNVTFSTQANAASQQTQIDGILNGTTTLANVLSTGGYFWANGTPFAGSYGNTQVAAYLNGSTSAVRNSAGSLTISGDSAYLILSGTAVGGIGGPVVYAANSSNIASQAGVYTTTGFFWANGTPYATAGGSYGNTQVAAYLASNTDPTISNLNANAAVQAVQINTINANLGAFQTYANLTFGTSNYGNANVAAYLLTNTGNIAAGNITTTGNTQSAYFLGSAAKLTSLTGVSAGTYGNDTTIPTIVVDATGRITQITTNAISGGGSYGNSNVAAYLAGTISVGNVLSTSGYFWANGTAYSTGGAGSYGNTEVAAYLPTYTGSLDNSSTIQTINANLGAYQTYGNVTFSTVANAASQQTQIDTNTTGIATLNANLGAYQTYGNVTFSTQANAASQQTQIDTNTTGIATLNANVGAYQTYGNVTFSTIANAASQQTQIDGILNGTTTLANVKSTGGYFWANGTPYATGGSSGVTQIVAGGNITIDPPGGTGVVTITATGSAGPAGPAFSGNLAGNVLYDSINERILANAFPLSTGQTTIPNNQTSKLFVNEPNYISGVLQQPPLANATPGGTGIVNTSSQTISLISSANVGLQSGYGFGSQNRDTIGSTFGLTVTPVTANTMAAQDRVRGALGSLDVVMTGQSWGVMNTSGQNQNTVSAINGASNFNGYGNLSSTVGGTYGSFITPAAAQTANIQYSTGVLTFMNLLNTAGTTGKANVVYSRGLTPFISGFSSNLTVQNAIGLHTYSGWAGSGAVGTANNPTTGRWALLNEDQNTTIQTNGNVFLGNGTSGYGSTLFVNSRFANVSSTTTFSGTTNFTGTTTFSTPPSGFLAKSNTAYAAGFGTSVTVSGLNLQATLSSSNIAQIGAVSGSITYSATTTEIIGGTQTVRNVVGNTMSGFQSITPTNAGLDSLGDNLVAIVSDQTNGVVYRITYIKTSIAGGAGSPFGGVTIERLI